MPSSTSVSNSAAVRYAKVLAGICAILIVALEVSAHYLLRHNSATYARISKQYERALQIRSAEPDEPKSVLMVGNSLLLHGVKVDQLQSLTAASMNIYPVFLEQTGYYDWFYGLRKLFRQGARPDVVIVGVGVNYFLENGVRPDYVPMIFFDARDTLAVASDLQLDHTATSNLLLAHSSTFWDTRSAIRTQVLNHAVPRLQELFSLITPKPSVPEGPEFAEVAVPRLEKLRDLCEAHGAKLILLVPPTLSSETAVGDMTRAAQATGVDVSVPIDPEALSAKFYQPDGMHLNSDGAVLFTSALAKDLPGRVIARETLFSRRQMSPLNPLSEVPSRLRR
jgi:hypothetical protein